MHLKLRITSEDRQSEVFVFAHPDNSEVSMNKKQHQQKVVEKCLAQILEQEKVKLEHYSNGAPFLPDFEDSHISISHSQDLYAIQLSKTNDVGIDVEVIRKNLFDGRSYFVNATEEKNLNLTNENLYLIWSAKEAVYKLKKGEIKQYKEGMTVVEILNSSLLVQIGDEQVKCSFVLEEDFIVLYVG